MTGNARLSISAEGGYLNCIRCGLCLSVCRTYREYLSQTASPHGRVALARKAPNKLGGTLSGEHVVGTLKRPYMQHALGDVSIEIQKPIKQALDPRNILNPGKVLPDGFEIASRPNKGKETILIFQ